MKKNEPPVQFRKFAERFIVLAFFAVLIAAMFYMPPNGNFPQKPKDLTYSEFLQSVESDAVEKVEIDVNIIRGKLKDGTQFSVFAPNDEKLLDTLKQHNVKMSVKPPPSSFVVNWLPQIAVMVIFILFFFFMIRQAQSGGAGQAMSFGKSRAKLLGENKPKITFDDVAGVEEAKEELSEVVDFLKNAKKFLSLGAKIPKGVLLLGPPGTGKTLLARAVAGEAGVSFFHISGSDFVEMFVGVGAARVRDLFEQAKRTPPCIIFIDELDAVGRQRGAGLGGGHDEREQTLNQLLVEMDGFDPNAGVILIAATNRPDVLDPALLRPGRFDRHVVVDKPDVKGRKAILQIHVKGKPLSDDVNLDVLARGTPGFSGADLANLVNEAALLAARRGKTKIEMTDMEEAKERVVAGPERKSRLISEKEKEIIAHHEAGHALVAWLIPGTDPVHKISILPRGLALGYTMQLPTEDRYLVTKSELLNHMCVMLGGRLSEELIFSEMTTGAHNDLERCSETARRMICEYGMSEVLGPLTFGLKHEQVFLGRDLMKDKNYSEEVAGRIDDEVKKVVGECYQKARGLLQAHLDRLKYVAKVLMEKETLEGENLERVLNGDELKKEEAAAAQNIAAQTTQEEVKPEKDDAKKGTLQGPLLPEGA